jgi:hypothetical protein
LRIAAPQLLDTPVVYRNDLVELVAFWHTFMRAQVFISSPNCSRFIRTWMRRGQMGLFQDLFNDTMYEVKRRQYGRWRKAMARGAREEANEIELNPYRVFEVAIENATPMLRLASVRRAGHRIWPSFNNASSP